MRIDTGGTLRAGGATYPTKGAVFNEHNIMFDTSSTFLQSGVFVVRENHPVMLVGYMVPTGASFTVEGVSVGSRAMPQGGGCCGEGTPILPQGAADILFREPMKLGGKTWELTEDNHRLVITLPGTYILSLNDEAHLGSIHVEAVELGNITTHIPDAYVAGI